MRTMRRGPMVLLLLLGMLLLPVSAEADVRPHTRPGSYYVDNSGAGRVSAVSKKAWKKIGNVCYDGTGTAVDGAITVGIDCSEWDGTIDWEKAAKDLDFAIARVSYSLKKMDPYFEINMKQGAANGVPMGVYIYSLARSEAEAIEEAKLCIKKMEGLKVSYPVCFDLEDTSVMDLSKKQLGLICRAFCNEIKKAGYTPMVYCNLDWYTNRVDLSYLTGIDIWLACYSDTKPAPDRTKYNYTIWQCTAGSENEGMMSTAGLIGGTSGNVDYNYGFVDYTKIISPRLAASGDYTPTPTGPDGGNGWFTTAEGKKYYVDGNPVTDAWKKIDKVYYRFDSNGILITDSLVTTAKGIYYVDEEGKMVKNKKVTLDGKVYWLKKNGRAYIGRNKIGGKFYYFYEDGHMAVREKVLYSAKVLYYFNKKGVMVRGRFFTIREDGVKNTYYFKSNGKAARGFMTTSGKTYYFYKTGTKMGRMAKSVTLTDSKGKSYVFGADGVLKE